jgi:hypothetical protein
MGHSLRVVAPARTRGFELLRHAPRPSNSRGPGMVQS